MERGKPFVPTRITERIGEAIAKIGREFTIMGIREHCPDLSWNHVFKIMRNKVDQEVIEQVGPARYVLMKEPFARMVPTAIVSQAVWQVLNEHRRHPLTHPEITKECEARTGRQGLAKAASMVITVWCRKGALVRTGLRGHRHYCLAKHITERPVTSERGLKRVA